MSIIKPTDDAFRPRSTKNTTFTPEPAVKIDTNKGKIAEERKARLAVAESKTDQEYLDLFETVKGLIVKNDFWELLPDYSLQTVYGILVGEMKKRKVSLPNIEVEKVSKVKTRKNKGK
jgi:hypothetical protein